MPKLCSPPEPVRQSLPCDERYTTFSTTGASFAAGTVFVLDKRPLNCGGFSVDEVVEEVRLAWDLIPDLVQAVMALSTVLPRKVQIRNWGRDQNLICEKAKFGDLQVLAAN